MHSFLSCVQLILIVVGIVIYDPKTDSADNVWYAVIAIFSVRSGCHFLESIYMILRGIPHLWSTSFYSFYFSISWALLTTAYVLEIRMLLLINILNVLVVSTILLVERLYTEKIATLTRFEKQAQRSRIGNEFCTRLSFNCFYLSISLKLLRFVNHWYYLVIPVMVCSCCIICLLSISLIFLIYGAQVLFTIVISLYMINFASLIVLLGFTPFFEHDGSFRVVMIISSCIVTVLTTILLIIQNYGQYHNSNNAWRRT